MSKSVEQAQVVLVKTSRKCANHPGKRIKIVCHTCDNKFICYECWSSGEHYEHDYTKFRKFIDFKKNSLGNLITESKEKEVKLKTDIKNVKQMFESMKADSRQCNVSIRQAEVHLTNLVKCREKAQIDITSISDFEILDIFDGLHRLLEYSTSYNFEDYFMPLFEEINIGAQPNPGPSKRRIRESSTKTSSLEVTEIRRFMFHHPVQRIYPVNSNEAWAVHIVEKKYQNNVNRVNIDGETIATVTLDTDVSDVTTTPEGDALISCFSDRSIRKVIKQSSLILFHCEARPLAIRVTNTGDIITSLYDKYVVVKYSITGQKLTTSNKSGNKQGILRPGNLAVCNKTGRVAVVDAGKPRYIVVMDTDLKFVFTYEGNTTTRTGRVVRHWSGKRFLPNDIAFDNEGLLLVADAYHTVIMVDTDGHFVRCVVTEKSGPDLFAVSVHESGKLWVGYDNSMIKVFTY